MEMMLKTKKMEDKSSNFCLVDEEKRQCMSHLQRSFYMPQLFVTEYNQSQEINPSDITNIHTGGHLYICGSANVRFWSVPAQLKYGSWCVSISKTLHFFHGLINLLKFKHSITFFVNFHFHGGLLLFDEPREGWRKDLSALFNVLVFLFCVRGSIQEAICSNIYGFTFGFTL